MDPAKPGDRQFFLQLIHADQRHIRSGNGDDPDIVFQRLQVPDVLCINTDKFSVAAYEKIGQHGLLNGDRKINDLWWQTLLIITGHEFHRTVQVCFNS